MQIILWLCLSMLLIMSLITFCVFGYDKRCAQRGRRRISEKTLLSLCLLLGAPGGMAGMRLWHHKTQKPPFPYVVPLLCILQGALILVFVSFC